MTELIDMRANFVSGARCDGTRATQYLSVMTAFLLLTASAGCAQTSTATIKKTNSSTLDVERTERQTQVISLLNSLAIEARSYRDEALRARVQAKVADVLWDVEPENARNLFHRAWEIAETIEMRVSTQTAAAGRPRSQLNSQRTGLRSEILRLAARRDRALGEEFLARMTSAANDANKTSASTNNPADSITPEQIAERLRLATDFLASGDVGRALQYADPALTRVSSQSIQFLVSLRPKDSVAADQRVAALLARAANDPVADANTVSLLTTYAFTPAMMLTVSPTGIPSIRSGDRLPPPDLSPSLRANYFRVAANILLRPFAQLDQSSAGRAGTYFMITRLMPLFQQFAPDLLPSLSSQLAALGPETGDATRRGSEWIDQGLKPPAADEDSLAETLADQLSRANTGDARDRAYAMAAMRAADKGDPRARDYLDKIEDLNTRNGIRKFIEYNLIGSFLRKSQVDEALALSRKTDLPPVLRGRAFVRAASIVHEKEPERANQLLEEALIEIRRIDLGAPEHAQSLIGLLSQWSKTNKPRTWELLSEMIKRTNALADFDGERGFVRITIEGKFPIAMSEELVSAQSLPELFTILAADDFYQAINAGKSFTGEAPRALATIAVAGATLRERSSKTLK